MKNEIVVKDITHITGADTIKLSVNNQPLDHVVLVVDNLNMHLKLPDVITLSVKEATELRDALDASIELTKNNK